MRANTFLTTLLNLFVGILFLAHEVMCASLIAFLVICCIAVMLIGLAMIVISYNFLIVTLGLFVMLTGVLGLRLVKCLHKRILPVCYLHF